MSYKVLYRKYRPDSFAKIVGQKNIVSTLKNSVLNSSFSHAYIFTGPRGTGKTSTAKVLAKVLTCSKPVNGEACNVCPNCLNFSTSPDIIEIDAASNNGVDEIRELRNNITHAPASSKYKIYIIDEVHMLSSGAFNALLKTLEEPPAHAIFILATTEVYKVPITILSRCQRYDFKKIGKMDMVSHLEMICKEEKIAVDNGVLEEIYSLSEGCLRDALSILDQTSKLGENLTLDYLLKSYNIISNDDVQAMLDSIKTGDIRGIIDKIENFESCGINAQKLLKRMINYLEKRAIEVKMGSQEYDFMTLYNLIEGLNRCYIDARINENVYTMIKLCFLKVIESSPSLVNLTSSILSKRESIPDVSKEEPKKMDMPVDNLNIVDIRINNCFVEVKKESLNDLTTKWGSINSKKISSIDKKDYKPVASSNKYAIFTSEEDSLASLFNIKSEDVEKMLKKEGIDIKVVAITEDRWTTEKEKYKYNIKNKKKYEYIDEPIKEDDGSQMKKEIEDLFTDSVIEIS